MRILQVLDSFSFGGAENLVVELARHAPAHWDVRAASLAPAGQGRDAMLGRLADAGLRPFHIGVRRLLDPLGFTRLTATLRSLRPDVVHAHLGYSATLVPLAARAAGIGCVATLHHLPGEVSRGEWVKERLSVRVPAAMGKLIIVSSAAFDAFARRHGPATDAWRMIPNGVDVDLFTRPRRVERTDDDRRPLWVVVAALRAPKGHLDLLAAWRILRDHGIDARLDIAGDGPHRATIERAISEFGLTDRVRLLGRHDDIPGLLAGVDGVVSASHTEALPTALIEAGAAGLPVVTTLAGGSTDVVTPETGWLVPVGDPEALAAALADAITHPELAAERGLAARNRVLEQFSMDSWLATLDQLYRQSTTKTSTKTSRSNRD